MKAALRTLCAVSVLLGGGPALAAAQSRPQPRPQSQPAVSEGRLEISGGVGISGGHTLDTEKATETGNGVPSGSPVTLFETASSFDRGTVFEGRIGWHLSRAFAVEGTFSMTRTHLRTEIRNDSEQAAATTATSPLNQYTAEGGVVVQPAKLRFGRGGRARIFIAGGGGYLRQLHDDATLVETGASAYAGGGLKYRLHEAKKRAALKAIGIRIDGRVNFVRGGFDVTEDVWHTYPSLSAGVFVCF